MRFLNCLIFLISLSSGPFVFAQKDADRPQDSATAAEPTKEMRSQMAQMHEKMATCLKSDVSFSECHQEMMTNCPMMKNGNCPMMGSGMHMKDHHGNMHGNWNAMGCCGMGASGTDSDQPKKKSKAKK